MSLPIHEIELQLIEALSRSNRVILEAPTGSGKSTQTPQFLYRNGLLDSGEVIVLQPRRIATRMLAKRVAFEMGERLGETAGYQIRHENVSSSKTRIRFATEGIFLRKLIAEPELKGVSILVFDEFHERSAQADIALARAVMLQETSRHDLKIIVMSATLDTDALLKYLEPCEIVRSEGRVFSVSIRYIENRLARSNTPVWDLAAQATGEAAREIDEGHVLVFMPGAYEIGRTIRSLGSVLSSSDFQLLPLHSELSAKDQDLVLEASRRRKVIVATNVAETSLTIENVRVVIDSGQARIARYDPSRGINTLWIEKISDASATQRTGRAGRTSEGLCIRLWAEKDHHQRSDRIEPEIARLDLSESVLGLLASGVENLDTFRWIETPSKSRLHDALSLLRNLGAINVEGRLTDLGERMSSFPVHPRYAAMLLAAWDAGCYFDMALITATAQSRGLLLKKVDKETELWRERYQDESSQCDFKTQINIWKAIRERNFELKFCRVIGAHGQTARQIGKIVDQLLLLGPMGSGQVDDPSLSDDVLRKCLLIGFPDRVCRRLDRGTYRCDMVGGKRGLLSRDSSVDDAELFVACEASEIGNQRGQVTTVLSHCSAIERDWLEDLYPYAFESGDSVFYDEKRKRVLRKRFASYLDLEIEREEDLEVDLPAAASILGRMIAEGKLRLEKWDDEVESFVARVNLIAEAFPEYGIDPIDTDVKILVLEQCCYGARSLKDLKKVSVLPHIKSWIGNEAVGLLDVETPLRLSLANGKRARLRYADGERPMISAKIQELYDLDDKVTICQGRVTPLWEILAPNSRPVQTTENLNDFWNHSYASIKKELKGRYPKHEWR